MAKRAKYLGGAAGTMVVLLTLLTIGQATSISQMERPGLLYIVLPMPFYLFAMAATWRSLSLVGKGRELAPALATLLRRAGLALFIGGLVEVFAVPAWRDAAGIAAEPLDITAIVIGVIGVGLYGLSGLIDEARKARAELEEFI